MKTPRHTVSERADLMAEWNYLKNDSLGFLPNTLGTGSHTKVWWICKEGHEWEASIVDRVKGHGCLYCSRQKPIVGENDFATLYPELVKEWHPTKNGKLKPEEFLPGSHKKVWWQCKNGHEWETEIKCRTSMKTNCPYCGSSISKKVLPGFNDLQTKYPGIAAEWDDSKNDTLKPTDVSYGNNTLKMTEVTQGCGKKANWVCKFGHNWAAVIATRSKGTGCPVCAKSKRVHARMRKVEKIDKETGEAVACYGSLTEAAASVSQSVSGISVACKKGTTAGGYKWKYAERVSYSVND